MKIATLQYQFSFPSHFENYQEKLSLLIQKASDLGVKLVLFPEYSGFEMLSFASLDSLQKWTPSYLECLRQLSQDYKMYICGGSLWAEENGKTYNRSYFFSPSGKISYHDKCLLTPFEKEEGILSSGTSLKLFHTNFGNIGLCICYDIEFPSLVDKLIQEGAKLILVPSYSSTLYSYHRVSTSCRARALENQCFVAHSVMVGRTHSDMTYGSAGVYSPIDRGFPENGCLSLGKQDEPDMVVTDLDFSLLEKIRREGQTRNFLDGKQLNLSELTIDSQLFD